MYKFLNVINKMIILLPFTILDSERQGLVYSELQEKVDIFKWPQGIWGEHRTVSDSG